MATALGGSALLGTSMPGVFAKSTSFSNKFNGCEGNYEYLKNSRKIITANKLNAGNPVVMISGIEDNDGNNKLNDWKVL